MKRVKIMLTAIGVLAVVGGSLAFKVKTVGSFNYCITTNAASATCNFPISAATFAATGVRCQMKYVLRNPTNFCSPAPLCNQTGFLGL